MEKISAYLTTNTEELSVATLTQDDNQSLYQIRGYQSGWLKINDTVFTNSVIVTPNQLVTDWGPQNVTELTASNLKIIIDIAPDILLLGTGSTFQILDLKIYGELINHGIGVEVMDTGAACRTFNALTSENRNVAAALIIN